MLLHKSLLDLTPLDKFADFVNIFKLNALLLKLYNYDDNLTSSVSEANYIPGV